MSEMPDQEKTEEATPRRREEARKKGQVARSRDLTTFMMLLGAGIGFLITAKMLYSTMALAFHQHFMLSREEIFKTDALFTHLYLAIVSILKMVLPLCFFTVLAVFLSSALMGGILFSSENIGFKASRINPLSGLKKILSKRSLMELIKSFGKFLLVATVALIYLNFSFPHVVSLANYSPGQAMSEGIMIVFTGFLIISGSLVVIVMIDTPFQIWEHIQQLRMTKQEVRDEFKEIEGRPEIKQRIRRIQQEMANRNMMQEIKTATVILTNPTHYAVAIRYQEGKDAAPRVVAKGVDSMAERIRQAGLVHEIMLVTAPPLARSLYYHTPLDKDIPAGLYVAVAQVLAYVYQIKRYQRGEIDTPPIPLENLPIPEELAK